MKSSFVVVGPGAIGTLIAAGLGASGESVVLADHDPQRAEALSSRPLEVHSSGGTRRVRVPCVSDPALLDGVEYMIFTVKAYDTAAAARQWSRAVTPETAIVSLQNGIGNVETLAGVFGAERTIAAVTSEASLYLSPGKVIHTAPGSTKLSSRRAGLPATKMLAGVLQRSGFRSMVSPDPDSIVWGKLVVNTAINPVTALSGLRNGELLRYRGVRRLVSRIAVETYHVGLALGVRSDISSSPSSEVLKAAEATAENRSSMLQDAERGRRTEIDFMCGAVYKRAKHAGVPAPLNATMYAAVKSLDERNERRREVDDR